MELRAAPDTGRLVAWCSAIGLFSGLAYLGRLSGERPPDDALYLWSSAILGLVQYAIFLVLVLAVLVGRSKREYLALRRPRSWGAAAGLAAAVFVGIWILSGVVSQFLNPRHEQGLLPDGWEPDRALPFAANFLVVALVAPVVEELLFRGLGFSLLQWLGQWPAVIGVGIAFALAHGLVEGFPLLAAFGMGLAYLRARTGSVYPGIVLHALFNAAALLLAVRFFNESTPGFLA